jgi:hypothetical protein
MPVAEGRAWASPTEEARLSAFRDGIEKERKAPTEPISGLVSGVRITSVDMGLLFFPAFPYQQKKMTWSWKIRRENRLEESAAPVFREHDR